MDILGDLRGPALRHVAGEPRCPWGSAALVTAYRSLQFCLCVWGGASSVVRSWRSREARGTFVIARQSRSASGCGMFLVEA